MTKKLLTFLTLLTLFFGVGWAETATWPGTLALPGSATYVGTDTHIKIKTSSTNTYTDPIRIYANNTITITADNGYVINSVTYEASSTGNYVTYAQNATVTPNVTPTVSGKNVTWSFGDNVTEFTFKPSNQTRANSITITYEASGGGGDDPTPTTGTIYERVTSISSTDVGKKFILVNQDGTGVLGAISTTNTKYGTVVTSNFTYNSTDHTITVPSTNSNIKVLTLGGVSDAWTFDMGGNGSYLYWTSGNSLNTNSSLSDNTKWQVYLNDGIATICNKANTQRTIRFNSDRFACYTTVTGTLPCLYREVEAAADKTYDVTVTQAEGGTITASPVGEKVVDAGDKITVTATPDAGYELSGWAITGAQESEPDANNQITANGNVTITAIFSLKNYVVAYEVTPSTAAANSGNRVGLINGAPYDDQTNASHSQMGTSVTFKLYTGNGWQIDDANVSVAYTDANGNPATLTPTKGDTNNDDGGYGTYFTFTMPASDVMINAAYLPYQPDLYILGNVNDGTHWNDGGLKMTYDPSANTYSIRIYASEENGYFRFYANGGNNGNPSYGAGGVNLNPLEGTQPKDLWKDGDANFCVPAGIYDIVVGQIFDDPTTNNNPNWWGQTTVTVTKIEPNFTFTPPAGEVYQGTTVTATSDLYTLLHAINSSVSESNVTNEVSLDGTTFSSSVALGNTGTATVTGKATYGHIAPTATATYTVNEIDMSNVYTLVESEDDLVAGEEYLIVGSTAAAPYSAILGPWPASGNYATAVKNNFTYNATDKTIILESGCTATPLTLGGSAGAWTFNNGSGFLAYTSTATSGSNNLWTVQNASNDGATWTIDTNKLPSSTALIVNVNNTSRKLNYNNDRFAGYVNAQSAVALFKKTSASSTSKAPVITPESGNIVGYSQEVTMTQSNGGNIYYTYTTDGTEPADPTEASTPYNSQNKFWAEVQNLGDEVWIKAVAKEGTKDLSSVVSVKYRFVSPKNPVFDPKAGTYSSAQSVSITTATEGAKVYYTTNANLAPAEIVAQGTEYTEPIIVTANTTFYAVSAYYDAHAERNAISSNKVTAAYVIVGEDDVVHVQNIAEFNSLETGLKAQFDNPVTVLYDYSQRSYSSQLQETTYQEYIWVKDETGFTQIYLRPSLNSNNTESKQTAFYENGDVIPAGFIVDKQLYETGQYVQAYSERAGEDPTLPGNNVEAGFFASTQKALADPEPMTAAQLAELTANEDNIATYNNRYISISKIKITSKNNKNFNFTDENGNGSNIAGYNKYSDATSYQKSGESAVVTVPDVSNTAYYDVTAILQVWQNGWEIMPIEFTEWKVDEVTLRKLCAEGNVGTEYTISNRLQCVYIQGNKLWVKDDNGQSILKKAPAEGDNNYEIGEEAGNKQLDQSLYDQSNWLEVHLADGSANAETFYRHIIKGGAITGTFTNKTNPTMENVVLTSTALENSDEIGGTVEYAPNYYCAANFYNGIEGGNQACIGSQHHGDFFFMNPKPQEYAMIVWAKYDGNNTFSVPAGEGANEHGFNGEFEVNMSMNSNPNFSPTTGKAYKFEAIVRRIESTGNTLRANKSNDYIVYPLTLSDDVVTGINNVTSKAVAGVKYYNLAGMESDRPFEGVNIIVTTYTDGSRSSAKVLK